MTREQCKALLPSGAPEAVVDRVLNALHGEIAQHKAEARRAAEALAAQSAELAAAREQAARAEDDRRALDELRERYDRDLRAAETRAEESAFSALVDAALLEQGARSPKAARALLDLDAIRAQPDREGAVRLAVHALAHGEDTAFLFDARPTGERRDVGGRVQSAPSPDDMLAVRAAAGLLAPR